MDRTDWTLLSIIDREKNMSKAAEKLFISQPAISYRLSRMEAEFGRTLFLRDKKGVQLNNHGKLLLSFANEMLQRMDDVVQAMNHEGLGYSGNITVGSTANYLNLSLVHQIKAFAQLYPNIHVHVRTGSSQNLLERMQREELFLSIVRGAVLDDWKGPRIEVAADPMMIISQEPATDEYLRTHPVVYNFKDTPANHCIKEWLRDNMPDPPREAAISLEGDSRSVIECVRSGFGWAMISGNRISESDRVYTRPVYRVDGTPFLFHTHLIYHEKCQRFDAYRVYINHFLSYFCAGRGEMR